LKKIIPAIIAILLIFAGCTPAATNPTQSTAATAGTRKIKVGFSQMEMDNAWRVCETKSIMDEAKKRGYELVYTDAHSSIQQAIDDVNYIISQQVDIILMAPRLYEGLQPALEAAKKANVPVILLDRTINATPGVDYVTCIMGDFIEVGQRAAKILADKFQGKQCNIVQMQGTEGASCVLQLSEGFTQEVAKHPNMKIIANSSGNFERLYAQKVIEKIIQEKGVQINAIFGHSDEEGIASIQALKAVGLKPGTDPEDGEICVVSMCGMLDAFKAIFAGDLTASIECSPRFGPIAFDTIERYFRGEKIETFIKMRGKTYDINNASAYLSEAY
jgi:galactofuranose transport system substrate-binding protein